MPQNLTVPYLANEMFVDISGAAGGSGTVGIPGFGARVRSTISVTAGSLLSIRIGCRGGSANFAAGGYNGGGSSYDSATGGGGASDIRLGGSQLTSRIIVAGGGGGIYVYTYCGGVQKGGNGGRIGSAATGNCASSVALGGNTTIGGAASTCFNNPCPTSGSLGKGGNGGYNHGGGGGGGYYGGGGGCYGGSGGGGSSYSVGSSTVYTTGYQRGDGNATVTFYSSSLLTTKLSSFSSSYYEGFPIFGINASDATGFAVNRLADITGDGRVDVIITAPAANNYKGVCFLLFGKAGGYHKKYLLSKMAASEGIKIFGNTNDQLGVAASGLWDFNGDGFNDFAVAGYRPNYSAGVAYVFYGGASLTNIDCAGLLPSQGFRITGFNGASLAGFLRLNNDTLGDLILTRQYVGSAAGSAVGQTIIVYGKAGGYSSIDLNAGGWSGFKITGEVSQEQSGSSVSSIGDFNGDGAEDIAIGAPIRSITDPATGDPVLEAGCVYVYLGSKTSNSDIDLSTGPNSRVLKYFMSQNPVSSKFGWSVSGGRDINKDGFVDMIIGAPTYNSNGAACIVYGSASPLSTTYLSNGFNGYCIYGVGGQFGYSVAALGDVNGDGYQDIAVGARALGEGRVYVVFGGPTTTDSFVIDTLPAYKGYMVVGVAAGDQLGVSVNPCDFNGDGFGDLIIGARTANGTTGAAYILYGNSYQTAIPTSLPSSQPSSQPSRQPITQPTGHPTSQPTIQPTKQPSSKPSTRPTTQPSSQPSLHPTSQPTSQPSRQPTSQPIGQPSARPSVQPSTQPTGQPSRQPTNKPTGQPSLNPTSWPTSQPSRLPTSQPTRQPSSKPTNHPSSRPSVQPSSQPTEQPSTQPTNKPSNQPSSNPTTQPSAQPSSQPTSQPTSEPSRQPTSRPTGEPSVRPTNNPSTRPSVQPSTQPTGQPTRKPTGKPTGEPSSQPINQPASEPSRQLTSQPTNNPSSAPSLRNHPTNLPTNKPSVRPSCQPSSQPSNEPSDIPSSLPSSQPTILPSTNPSCTPTLLPTTQPSSKPTKQPTSKPSNKPSSQPSSFPSSLPSTHPSSLPSSAPSNQPSVPLTTLPFAIPSHEPSSHPSASPTTQPTTSPSSPPSSQPSNTPTIYPTAPPTSQPSSHPTNHPTTHPTKFSSTRPSSLPSNQPTSQPSRQPTSQPISQPTDSPTYYPTTHSKPPFISSRPSISVLPRFTPFKQVDHLFGSSVSSDLLQDIQIEASYEIGESYVVFGNNDHQSTSLKLSSASSSFFVKLSSSGLMTGESSKGSRSIAVGGDFNGDGLQDLLVGQPMNSKFTIVYSDRRNPQWRNMTSYLAIISSKMVLGWSVSSAGDFDDDGHEDIIVSSLYESICYLLRGGRLLVPLNVSSVSMSALLGQGRVRSITLGNDASISLFGIAVSNAGDFNGDGVSDVMVSALGKSGDNKIFIIYGGRVAPSSMTSIVISQLLEHQYYVISAAKSAYSFIGLSVTSVGDMNGDGLSDIAFGSLPFVGGYTTQLSYVVYGRSNGSGSLMLSEINGSRGGFVVEGGGFVVSGIGDVNHDGYDDLLISNYMDWQGRFGSYIIRYPIGSITSHPSQFPTPAPSTSRPSSAPSSSPSEATTAPYITRSPDATSKPSKAPVIPPTHQPITSSTPSVRPTTLQPSTLRPSPCPTVLTVTHRPSSHRPSLKPSFTSLPTSQPSSHPSWSQLRSVMITAGGEYRSGNGDERFTIDTEESVKIVGIGGKNRGKKVYVIMPGRNLTENTRQTIRIEAFDLSSDVIDLSKFTIQQGSLVMSTYPSLTIQLSTNQWIVLPSYSSFVLTEKNIVFPTYTSEGSDGGSESFTVSSLLSWMGSSDVLTVMVVLVTLFIGYFVFANYNKMHDRSKKRKVHDGGDTINAMIENKPEEMPVTRLPEGLAAVESMKQSLSLSLGIVEEEEQDSSLRSSEVRLNGEDVGFARITSERQSLSLHCEKEDAAPAIEEESLSSYDFSSESLEEDYQPLRDASTPSFRSLSGSLSSVSSNAISEERDDG